MLHTETMADTYVTKYHIPLTLFIRLHIANSSGQISHRRASLLPAILRGTARRRHNDTVDSGTTSSKVVLAWLSPFQEINRERRIRDIELYIVNYYYVYNLHETHEFSSLQ